MVAEYQLYLGKQIINLAGQFLDALLSIYFLHKFFDRKRTDAKNLWIFAAILMTIVTQIADYFSGNNLNVWMFLLFVLPFFYTVLFEQGKLSAKFLICEVPYIILISLEYLGVVATYLSSEYIGKEYYIFLTVYIFRRIILKVVLLAAVKFLLNYSSYTDFYEFRRYWYLLGAICLFEFLVLYALRGYMREVKVAVVYLVLTFFCVMIPILFYYVVYLMTINLKRLQIGISQKNYIDAQEQYMTQLVTLEDSLRKFKHDYQAHIFCMDNLLLEKNYEELHLYLQNFHEIDKKYHSFKIYTSDNRVNVLMNQMNDLAAKKGIHLKINVKEIKIQRIALYDLNMLLSNLYSNAVEAALKTEEKEVGVLMEKNRAYLQIVIWNSTQTNPMKNNPDFITSKEDKEIHGFGMQIIRNVVERYQGMLQFDGTDTQMKINVLLLDEV